MRLLDHHSPSSSSSLSEISDFLLSQIPPSNINKNGVDLSSEEEEEMNVEMFHDCLEFSHQSSGDSNESSQHTKLEKWSLISSKSDQMKQLFNILSQRNYLVSSCNQDLRGRCEFHDDDETTKIQKELSFIPCLNSNHQYKHIQASILKELLENNKNEDEDLISSQHPKNKKIGIVVWNKREIDKFLKIKFKFLFLILFYIT